MVCGDLGYSVLEIFADSFPDRYVNAGVAEQNMTGIAAGIALSGGVAVTYSIANFPVLRCLEQIRNDICYHRLDVMVVAVGGGFSYGPAGYTHHGTEDLAIMRALPGMTVIAPGDPVETGLATRQAMARGGPCYLRLGRADEVAIHSHQPDAAPGAVIPVREGIDALIVTTGGLLGEALRAADRAADRGRSVAVWSCPWLSPFDSKAFTNAFLRFALVITAEEGTTAGGLGSAAAGVCAALPEPRGRLVQIGLGSSIMTEAFSQSAARSRVGLDGESIAQVVMAELDAISSS